MSRIDPRVIILQILITAACMFWIASPLGILLEICLLTVCLLYLRLPWQALRLAVYFLIVELLFELTSAYDVPLFFERIFFLLHRLSPMVGIVILSTRSISVSQLVTGMQKLRCPKKMALTVAVALRFLPTIRQELSQIQDALKTRGLPLNPVTFMKAPVLTTEYVLVPFMMRGVRVADEQEIWSGTSPSDSMPLPTAFACFRPLSVSSRSESPLLPNGSALACLMMMRIWSYFFAALATLLSLMPIRGSLHEPSARCGGVVLLPV